MRIAMRSAVTFALFGGVALAGVLTATASSRAAGPAEKALPDSTFAYLKIDNVAKLRQGFKASQIGQLLADPALQPLKQDLIAKLEEPSKKVKEALGVTIDELLTLPQGAVNIALLSREPGNGSTVVILASADAGENDAKMSEVLAKATKAAEGTGAKVATETFKDAKLTIIRKNDDDKEPLIWTKVGSVFHVATDLGVLKDFLSNASGRKESLATNENYLGVEKAIGAGSQLSLFVDVTKVIELAIASNPNGNADQLKAQLQLTGINGFKAAGASFAFGQGDYDQVLKLFVYSPGPAQGVLKIFSMPPIDLKPQSWVPASVNSYQSLSWDIDGAFKAITELADQFGLGGFIDQAQKGIGGPNGDFDFKKDVFGPLGNRITAISDFKKPITEKSQRAMFAIALDDEKAFQTTFNKILDLTKATPKKRDFQGTTIYDFDVPKIPNAGANGLNIEGPISVAITKGNLFLSTEPTFLEQVLRSGGAGLADSPEFQAVAKKLPAKNSVLSFDKTEEQARLIYEMIKGDGFQKAIDQANPNGPKIKNPIDPKKVPEFAVFAKYLGQGGSYGIMDEQGVTITSFVLRKANP
ncbi:MAG: hypothetical protein JWN86_2295 [Planctomycetota bacterium]|nr:hypothetical protein [Planctomycetota bacterium]